MAKRENNKGKYLLLLLFLLISFGMYHLIQNGKDTISQSNSPKAVEKTLPKKLTTPKAPTQKDNQFISSEQTSQSKADSGAFIDTRDGQTYRWIRLKDGKKWMAENLNYKIEDTRCYNEASMNCDKYGGLYTWQAANKACPKGWRLPTDHEWWTMTSHYGKAYNSYPGQEKMEGKDDGEMVYQALIQGGATGFAALFGGSYSASEGFDYLDVLGCYWTSSPNSTSTALGYYFYIHSRGLARDSYNKGSGFSCRCLQD